MEYKLEEFITYEQPAKYIVESDQYNDSYDIPVLTAGQTFILGYTNEQDNIFDNLPVIIFDDFTTSVQYVDFPFKVKSSAMKLLKNTSKSNLKYCYYMLKYFQKQPENHKRQWISSTSQIKIDLPNIDNQSKIVEKLDFVQEIIAKYKRQLNMLDELVKARFVELFGTLDNPTFNYNKSTLGELCYKITDGKHGGCSLIQGSNRYFVGAREIYDDKVHYENAPEISVDDFEKDYRRCNVEVGDFLIVNTGATIGKSAIATDKRTKHTLLQKSVALLKLNQDLLNPEFLKWCYRINTRMYLVESSSAQPNLLLSKIKATEIYVPPIELQNQFADFVKEVDKSRFIIKCMIKEGLL